MNIKKIKWSESAGKITINYEKNTNGNMVEYTATFSKQARPEFYEAFQDLDIDVLAILDIDIARERIHPYGITLKDNKSGLTQAIISAKMDIPLHNTSTALNTPMLIEQSDDNADGGSYFNKDTVYKIRRIIEEAIIFIEGNRAQMKLFEQEKEEDAILAASM